MSDVPRSLNVDQWAINGSLMAHLAHGSLNVEKNPRRIFWVPLEISRTGGE